ncbi:hypothetical protein RchiOBHm_Chr1g0339461 [Rosa chinensis]|uniref:Uncharacterized protein n=1 Tax=Rosa chinensis TaxID=74649 RepID=A0A2P6SD88_ROSCH|nr:hypothetical protein RchiOBHm_Chr1g0339461 [Rosa chinensis]
MSLQYVMRAKSGLEPMVALLQLVSLYRRDKPIPPCNTTLLIIQGYYLARTNYGVNAVLHLFMVDMQLED